MQVSNVVQKDLQKRKDTKSKSDRNLKRRKISIMLLEMN